MRTRLTPSRRRDAEAALPPAQDGERFVRRQVRRVKGRGSALRECGVDAVHERTGVKRFAEEADGTRRFDLTAQPLLGEGGDEDDRDPTALAQQRRLQLNAAHSRHLDIADQARGLLDER